MAFDPYAFEQRYGFSPQEYVNRVAISTLRGAQIPALVKRVAAAKAKVLATAGWEALQPSNPKFQKGANAENEYTAAAELLHAAEYNQGLAQQFRDGAIPFVSFVGSLGQTSLTINEAGFVDGDAVRAAMQAA